MASLVQTGKYVTINAAYPKTIGYYSVKYVYEDFTLQEDTTT